MPWPNPPNHHMRKLWASTAVPQEKMVLHIQLGMALLDSSSADWLIGACIWKLTAKLVNLARELWLSCLNKQCWQLS